MLNRRAKLELLKKELIDELKLTNLKWEANIASEDIFGCMKRLKKVEDAIRNQIQGLTIIISSNSHFHIQPNGDVSLPYNFQE